MRTRFMGFLLVLCMVGSVYARDMAIRIPPPTRPLYGQILNIETDGTFVVKNRGLYRWSPAGTMSTIPVPNVYGTILAVDPSNTVLSMISNELYAHGGTFGPDGETIRVVDDLFGKPLSATVSGDVFSVNAGSILWYRPDGSVVASNTGGQTLYGTPLHADTQGNVYMLNGGDVYRYTVTYEPTQLYGSY